MANTINQLTVEEFQKHFNRLPVNYIIVVGFACYNAGKSTVYEEDYNYFEKTEALLDSINNWDESFMDTVMETDAYYEYELAKEEYTK